LFLQTSSSLNSERENRLGAARSKHTDSDG
jgi:hypothetical protein